MVYRIRYHDSNQIIETEAVVEANSPAEAMIKFRCIHTTAKPISASSEMVTSVSSEDYPIHG